MNVSHVCADFLFYIVNKLLRHDQLLTLLNNFSFFRKVSIEKKPIWIRKTTYLMYPSPGNIWTRPISWTKPYTSNVACNYRLYILGLIVQSILSQKLKVKRGIHFLTWPFSVVNQSFFGT